jgi:hypothetical protein
MARTASSTYQHDWNDDTWTTGSPTTAAETLSGTTESLTGSINATTYWSLQVTFDINYDATPTDEVTINVYGSKDGTNWDDTAIDFVTGDSGTDPEQQTIMIFNPPAYVRIGFVQSGSTDSHEISTVFYIGFN